MQRFSTHFKSSQYLQHHALMREQRDEAAQPSDVQACNGCSTSCWMMSQITNCNQDLRAAARCTRCHMRCMQILRCPADVEMCAIVDTPSHCKFAPLTHVLSNHCSSSWAHKPCVLGE
jgi:hypothetical protein